MSSSGADEILAKAGLFIDDLNSVRLINPDIAETCGEVVSQTKELTGQMTSFESTTDNLIQTIEELAQLVEAEKLRAMASRTALKTAGRQRTNDLQQLQLMIRERQVEVERLRVELTAVQAIEQEQKEHIQMLQHGR